MEYLALIAEIESLKEEVAVLRASAKPKKLERIPCSETTGKGEKCKRFCIDGGSTCKIHSRPKKEVKPKKQKLPKVCCIGLNIRGNPCKNKCIENQTWCEKHDPSIPHKVKKMKVDKKLVVEPLLAYENSSTMEGWVSELEFWRVRNEPRMI
jgi:hypothetical protein